jgi:hypothetical protein
LHVNSDAEREALEGDLVLRRGSYHILEGPTELIVERHFIIHPVR